jgi:hypothetical protein
LGESNFSLIAFHYKPVFLVILGDVGKYGEEFIA